MLQGVNFTIFKNHKTYTSVFEMKTLNLKPET